MKIKIAVDATPIISARILTVGDIDNFKYQMIL